LLIELRVAAALRTFLIAALKLACEKAPTLIATRLRAGL
jgi:hypothetical protein